MAQQQQLTLEEVWGVLREGMGSVFAQQQMGKKKYMKLYTLVYNYCTNVSASNHFSVPRAAIIHPRNTRGARTVRTSEQDSFVGQDLYSKIRDYFAGHLDTLLRDKLTPVMSATSSSEEILQRYISEWEEYIFSSKVIDGFSSYLNKHWVKRQIDEGRTEVFDVYDLAVILWRQKVFKEVSVLVTESVLRLIKRERQGETICTRFISGVVSNYVELGITAEDNSKPATHLHIYRDHLEVSFLEETEGFYVSESAHFLQQNPVTEYIKRIDSRLREEKKRVNVYLNPATEEKLISTCEQVFILRHWERLANEFKIMLRQDQTEDLSRLYSLVSHYPKLVSELKESLLEHISQQGHEAIRKVAEAALTDPKVYVSALLKIYKKYNELITNSLDCSQCFSSALDSACTRFINTNAITQLPGCSQVKSAELIAKYCDLLLRKSAKNVDDTEIEEQLTQIMVIFRYIEDKDVFQKFYSRMLAKRLVAGHSASDDAEASMITKLKQACGFEYTTKLQRMFQDEHLSRELNEKLKNHQRVNPAQKMEIDFSIQVLTSGSWPFQPGGEFALPQTLERPFTRFTQFYNMQYSGRVLTWLHQMSKGEIVTNCYKQKYTLQLSTYQMALLLLFNETDQICLENIQAQLLIREEVVLQMSLVLIKIKLLICEENENQICMKSVLKFNPNFRSKKFRINLNVPLKLEQKVEQDATEKHVEEDRKIIIQAAIVRIMKMRKQLNHQFLLSEVVGQISNIFKPKVQLIKKCIDILIEKDFLERVDGQKDIYRYLA